MKHWNYLLVIEQDLKKLGEYVEFSSENLSTYSQRIALLLMSAAQECDVLLKQLCKDSTSENEENYRKRIPELYPNFTSRRSIIRGTELSFEPFSPWSKPSAETPNWWTSNNKTKHHRHTHFERANLDSLLNAVSAVLICNLYFYHMENCLSEIEKSTELLLVDGTVEAVTTCDFGMRPVYNLGEP